MIRLTQRFAPAQQMKLPKPAPRPAPVPWFGHKKDLVVPNGSVRALQRVSTERYVAESDLDRRLLELRLRRGLPFAKVKEMLNFEFRHELDGNWLTSGDCRKRMERMATGCKKPNERLLQGSRVPIPRRSNDGDNAS